MLPWFDFFFIEPVEQSKIIFNTESNLMNTKMPVLILHARDDIVIPFKLGERVKYKYIFDYNLYIILNERNMLIYFKC